MMYHRVPGDGYEVNPESWTQLDGFTSDPGSNRQPLTKLKYLVCGFLFKYRSR